MERKHAMTVTIIPHPTLAYGFTLVRDSASRQIVEHFKEKGVVAVVTPEWVRGPITGTERCIELKLDVPTSMLDDGRYHSGPAPVWKLIWELGKPG